MTSGSRGRAGPRALWLALARKIPPKRSRPRGGPAGGDCAYDLRRLGARCRVVGTGGARVILSDISLGVVLQARERAKRFGLDINLIVADAEAFLSEMARSRSSTSTTAATTSRIRPWAWPRWPGSPAGPSLLPSRPPRPRQRRLFGSGLAEAEEEAGNPVRRLTLGEIVSELSSRCFRPLQPHRYALYYRHWPGRAVRILSQPVLFPLARAGFAAVNRLCGRYGNKLAVQAVRVRDATDT
jgi:hypothetical protein